MKNVFSATALDKLINESLEDTNNFKDELTNINEYNLEPNLNEDDSYLTNDNKTWSETKNIIDKKSGSSVSFDYVYKKIGQLIDTGNSTLELLQSIDPDVTNPATLGATASLLNSIKGCISEFTKIHQQYIRFQNTLILEKLKLENKKELIRFKKAVAEGKDKDDIKPTELIETASNDILNYVKFKREQRENGNNE